MGNAIQDEIRTLIGSVRGTYAWRLPKYIYVPFLASGDSVDDNLRLRRSCNEAWASNPVDRLNLARWYVKDWGGVKTNTEETLKQYVSLFENDHIPDAQVGVPTWSKIGSISNPDKYLIFDTRVAFALNAIIVLGGYSEKLFQMPTGRNSKLNKALPKLKSAGVKDIGPRTSSDEYHRYLALLSHFGHENSLAEMALFSAAEDYAAKLAK